MTLPISEDGPLDLAMLQFFIEEPVFLINEETEAPAAAPTPTSPTSFPLHWYGDNKKGVVVLLDIQTGDLLKTKEFAFLLRVLEAIKLTLNECAILNLTENQTVTFSDLKKLANLNNLLLFGVPAGRMGIATVAPTYTLQATEGVQWVQTDPLGLIMANKDKKFGLWTALQRMFPEAKN